MKKSAKKAMRDKLLGREPPRLAQVRDRIVELVRVKASDLTPHPLNWRTHPIEQQAALAGALDEIGYATAIIARRLPDGTLQLLDGHLRQATTPEATVPVLLVDLDDAEAAKFLATADPISAMAESDKAMFSQVLDQINTSSEALAEMLAEQFDSAGGMPAMDEALEAAGAALPDAKFEIIVTCESEDQQRELYDRFAEEGLACRVLTF